MPEILLLLFAYELFSKLSIFLKKQKYVGEVFNIVSQQSTARPGCIIALDPITKLVSINFGGGGIFLKVYESILHKIYILM